MPKIKEVYEYNNGSWANGTPIGADASNVDVALSDSTSTRDLQTVLGNVSVSDPSMKTQLTGKVNASGGDIKDTVVSVLDPASETDTSEDIDGTDVVVAAGESQTTMWSKFNMFRKRVSNKFSNFLISSVEDVLEPSDTKTYSQAALNSYFADVIGYKTDADVATIGSVADQLSTLNNNFSFERVEGASNISRYNCSGGTISTYDCIWEINQTHTLFHFMCRIGLWDVTRTGGNPGVKMIFPFSSYFTEAMDFHCIGRYGAGNSMQYEQANGSFNISDGYFYLQATETTANIPTSGTIFFSCNAWYNLQ